MEHLQPASIPIEIWARVASVYRNTVELRNSLVHRPIYVDPTGALVGQDRSGDSLPPVSPDAQDAFAQAVLLLSEGVVLQDFEDRRMRALNRYLAELVPLHGSTIPSSPPPPPIPELTVVLDQSAGRYTLDIDEVRTREPFASAEYVDLVVEFRERPGLFLETRLENAPGGVQRIDPSNPPAWLQPTQ